MKATFWMVLLLVFMTGCGVRQSGEGMEKAELAQKWFRGIYGSDPRVVDELGSENVLITYPIFNSLFGKPVVRGKQAVKNFAVGFCERWKETEIVFHETIVQGDRAVLVWSFRGRNVGSAREDVQPTNEIMSWGGITLIRFDDEGEIEAEIGEESDPGPMGRLPSAGE